MHPPIFILIATLLLDQSNKTSSVIINIYVKQKIDNCKKENCRLNFVTEMNKPLPAPVQCLTDQIQVQHPTLVAAKEQMLDHTYRRQSYHQHS